MSTKTSTPSSASVLLSKETPITEMNNNSTEELLLYKEKIIKLSKDYSALDENLKSLKRGRVIELMSRLLIQILSHEKSREFLEKEGELLIHWFEQILSQVSDFIN
jgi:hypothetical protein